MDKTRISTARLTPGMKLGEPITNANGVTLMPSGIRLTPMFIARIRKWNIEYLDVYVDKPAGDAQAGDGDQADDDLPAAGENDADDSRAGALRLSGEQQEFARSVAVDISRVFVNVKNIPLMMDLRAAAIKRLVMHGPKGVLNVMRRQGDEPGEAAGNGS